MTENDNMIALNQKSPTHVVARNSCPPLAGMSDVAISSLFSLRQPCRNKRRDCHAPICAKGASLRSQRLLRYINPQNQPHKSYTKISMFIYPHNLKPNNDLHNRPHNPLRRIYIEIFYNHNDHNNLQAFFKKSCGRNYTKYRSFYKQTAVSVRNFPPRSIPPGTTPTNPRFFHEPRACRRASATGTRSRLLFRHRQTRSGHHPSL